MNSFRCPQCGGESASRWKLPHPLLVHWVLNPGLVFNELILGQCVARETYFCNTCTGPKVGRAYLHCPTCGTWHPGSLWSKGRALGQWLGYVCANCGGRIPRLWNAWSLVILALLAPLWWLPVSRYRERWQKWQWERIRGAEPADMQATLARVRWFRLGLLYWGLPVGVTFSLVLPLFLPGVGYWRGTGLLLLFLPIWLGAGLLFALTMRWVVTKWGTS